MSSSVVLDSPVDAALTQLESAVDALAALGWDAVTDDEVLQVAQRVEVVKRRLAPVDHAMIGQLEARSLPFTHGARSTAVLLSTLLRISRPEATGRVQAAQALGPRRTVTGQPVEPRFPTVAAAQADGDLSDRHAAIITHTIDKLPVEVADTSGTWLEDTLVEHARHLDPTVLASHAAQLAYALDQDGHFDEAAHRDRTRDLRVSRRPDGSAHVEGELSAECAEHLVTTLDALTKPKPSTEAGPDPRTAGQRRHDAFFEVLKLVQRAELLPHAGGITTTVLLTMDADAWVRGEGTARTGHGYTVSAETAKRWAGHDARLILTLLRKTRSVEAYSASHRIFTEQQRLAMIARDHGCTFPGCDAAPAWCEAHHVTDWAAGGATTIANGALACCGDHRDHERMGWHATMIDGRPYWVPPKWLDQEQKPRRNTRHDRPDPPPVT